MTFIAVIYSNPKQNMHFTFQSYGTWQTKLLAGFFTTVISDINIFTSCYMAIDFKVGVNGII